MTRLGLAVFFTLNVVVFSMALWTQDVYPQEDTAHRAAMATALYGLFRYAAMTFALPVPFLLAGPLLASAWRSARCGLLSTDLLLVAGMLAAFAYSIHSVFAGAGHVYFEIGCIILVMITLGRWLEASGKHRTTETLAQLERLLPDVVTVVRGGEDTERQLADVRIGDTLRVLAGQRIPVDGTIQRNRAAIDQQMLTGESVPVEKGPGDDVLAGTLNLDGELYITATRDPEHGAMRRLIDCVREARLASGRYQSVADRAATWFAPLVVTVALATFGWHSFQHSLAAGIMASLAVVLIACPCALGIATPLAVWTALSRAAGAQVVFRSGEAIERLATVRALRLDKTGTLTTGTATVDRFNSTDELTDSALVECVAAALAVTSAHTFSDAIVRFVPARHNLPIVTESRTLAGRGVEAFVEEVDATVHLGSMSYLRDVGLDTTLLPESARSSIDDGLSLVAVGWSGHIRGIFTLREQLRSEAHDVIAACRTSGLDVAVLTGDHPRRGDVVSRQLGVPVAAGLLPDDKLETIQVTRQRIGPVAMVGDGVNDAPALAAADIGIAMGCGADVTRESADICLLGSDLRRLPWSIDLARRTVRVIRTNLAWAFAYNLIGVALAATGKLNPIIASLAMVASSGLVVANSIRLRQMPLVGELSGDEKRNGAVATGANENMTAALTAPGVTSTDTRDLLAPVSLTRAAPTEPYS
jgi:heavy metal translocating P-type ATPase